MTRDVLRCKCGKPVGIVRLNGRTLRLAHENTGRKHVVRLARPASDSLPGEVLARTGAPPVVAGQGGVPLHTPDGRTQETRPSGRSNSLRGSAPSGPLWTQTECAPVSGAASQAAGSPVAASGDAVRPRRVIETARRGNQNGTGKGYTA